MCKTRYVDVTLEIRNLLFFCLKDPAIQLNMFSTDNECMANGNEMQKFQIFKLNIFADRVIFNI